MFDGYHHHYLDAEAPPVTYTTLVQRQRRPHEVARFLKQYSELQERTEATNLLLILGLNQFETHRRELARAQRHCFGSDASVVKSHASTDADAALESLVLLRQVVRSLRSSSSSISPLRRAPSQSRASTASKSPPSRRASPTPTNSSNLERCRCCGDEMTMASKPRQRSPIRQLVQRDKQKYEAASSTPHARRSDFQLVEKVSLLPATRQRPMFPSSADSAATVADSAVQVSLSDGAHGIDTAIDAGVGIEEVQHRAHFQNPDASVGAKNAASTSSASNMEASPSTLSVSASASAVTKTVVSENHRTSSALAQIADDEQINLDSLGSACGLGSRELSSADAAVSSIAGEPAFNPTTSSLPPDAVKAIWKYVEKERGARRNPLVVAAALPSEFSVVALSAEFPEVYRSLLLAYHLQRQEFLLN